jgi:FkbM family methyltransferase
MEYESIEEKVIFEKLKSASQNTVKDSKVSISSEQINSNNSNDVILENYLNEIYRHINTMESTRVNTSNRFISSRKGKIGVLLKKIIRKLLRWYIEPICVQQTEFNNAVTPTIGRISEIHTKLISDNMIFRKRMDELEKNLQTELESIKAIKSDLNNIYEQVNKQFDENDKKFEFISKIVDSNNYKLNKLNELNPDIFEENRKNIWDKRTLSQSGEDAIIAYILMVLGIPFEKCRYLDLGANHAKELSNTYYLYSNGARGVLVEANPNLIPELKFYRHEDIIINKCVDVKSNEYIDFYILSGDGVSTPDKKAAEEFISKNPNLKIVESVKIETISVEDIFMKYFNGAPTILNVDIEGKDLEILKSIDFDKYRPLIIIVEMIEYDTTLVVGKKDTEILEFMESKDYVEYAFTGINSIFLDKKKLGREKKNEYSV